MKGGIVWVGGSIAIAPQLVDETYCQLRMCSGRRRECHALWIASWRDSSRIVRVVHPRHAATAVSVDIDMAWLNAFFLDLAEIGECIRVQVHSHPGSAFHSSRDDAMPVLRMPGFLSLVIPDFAAGEPDLERTYLTEQDGLGGWHEASLLDRIRIGEEMPA